MGTTNCKRDPLHILEEALQAGITLFQFREKGEGALQGEAYAQFARQCQQLCRAYDVPFIVNDDVALAIMLEADGVHIGQDDAALTQIRAQLSGKMIGVSVHNEEELHAAVAGGADYVGIGAIFSTNSKHDHTRTHISFLQQAKQLYPHVPIVAIGGITCETSQYVRAHGADGVAVISAITLSDNIHETVKRL